MGNRLGTLLQLAGLGLIIVGGNHMLEHGYNPEMTKNLGGIAALMVVIGISKFLNNLSAEEEISQIENSFD